MPEDGNHQGFRSYCLPLSPVWRLASPNSRWRCSPVRLSAWTSLFACRCCCRRGRGVGKKVVYPYGTYPLCHRTRGCHDVRIAAVWELGVKSPIGPRGSPRLKSTCSGPGAVSWGSWADGVPCTRASFDAARALLTAVSKWPGGNSANEVGNGAWRSLDSVRPLAGSPSAEA